MQSHTSEEPRSSGLNQCSSRKTKTTPSSLHPGSKIIETSSANSGPTSDPWTPKRRLKKSSTISICAITPKIIRYMVDFNRLASEISWDDAALRRRFYKGLPGRIKDEISRD